MYTVEAPLTWIGNSTPWLILFVSDRGVGGSNPLYPANLFNSLQTTNLDHLVLARVVERAGLHGCWIHECSAQE